MEQRSNVEPHRRSRISFAAAHKSFDLHLQALEHQPYECVPAKNFIFVACYLVHENVSIHHLFFGKLFRNRVQLFEG
jgi:hypothetical protein